MNQTNDRATALNTNAIDNSTLSARIYRALTLVNMEPVALLAYDFSTPIPGIGSKSLAVIMDFIADNQNYIAPRNYPMIEAIRTKLSHSKQFKADMKKLATYHAKGNEALSATYLMVQEFMANDYFDRGIEKYLENMVEFEMHHHIAAMSYVLPAYNLATPVLYMVEKAKIALATTIVQRNSVLGICREKMLHSGSP